MRALLLCVAACSSQVAVDPWNGQQQAALTGEFSLLTYNIAGLPEIFSSSTPSENVELISPLLNAYDVVLAQEDFWYHDDLISSATHAYRSEPYDNSYLDMGDGLNQLSVYHFDRFERSMWLSCNGILTCCNDCLASKGFTFSVLKLPGLDVHLYNLHMDAGDCRKDKSSRAEEMQQLAQAITERSANAALIVAGDTNLSAFAEDQATLDAFLTATGLRDACRTLGCPTESIDRVLLRGPLEPLAWSNPPELSQLSDHEPVLVRIGYRTLN